MSKKVDDQGSARGLIIFRHAYTLVFLVVTFSLVVTFELNFLEALLFLGLLVAPLALGEYLIYRHRRASLPNNITAPVWRLYLKRFRYRALLWVESSLLITMAFYALAALILERDGLLAWLALCVMLLIQLFTIINYLIHRVNQKIQLSKDSRADRPNPWAWN